MSIDILLKSHQQLSQQNQSVQKNMHLFWGIKGLNLFLLLLGCF
jgi:hypothetical protein